jgi:hypothetical protein
MVIGACTGGGGATAGACVLTGSGGGGGAETTGASGADAQPESQPVKHTTSSRDRVIDTALRTSARRIHEVITQGNIGIAPGQFRQEQCRRELARPRLQNEDLVLVREIARCRRDDSALANDNSASQPHGLTDIVFAHK